MEYFLGPSHHTVRKLKKSHKEAHMKENQGPRSFSWTPSQEPAPTDSPLKKAMLDLAAIPETQPIAQAVDKSSNQPT